jgi:6-phosphogluconolactonase
MILKKLLLSACLVASQLFVHAQQPTLIIGTYTNNTGSEGIYAYSFDTATLEATKLSSIKSNSPSYLAINANTKNIYAVNENGIKQTPTISAFKYDVKDKKLTGINIQNSIGASPCYIALDKTNKWLAVANYRGGNIVTYSVQANGLIGKMQHNLQHYGKSVDSSRQKAPHAHCAVFTPNNKFILAADLGLDKIMAYSFNEVTGKTTIKDSIQLFGGAGPRHIEFNKTKPVFYVVEELTGTISVVAFNNLGNMQLLQRCSILPEAFGGKIGSADIHISADNKFLYATNRGDGNDIAVLKVDAKSAKLQLIQNISVQGKAPRNFTIHPNNRLVLIGNQNSNEIAIFKRNVSTGLLEFTGKKINVPSPVCLKWL